MSNSNRYTVTAALPYANGPLHLGHLAGAYIAADIYVRCLRMLDKDVAFVCGSDEYGAAIQMKALKEGKSPQEIVDQYHQIIESAFSKMDIDFDIYSRTTDPVHAETSQDFFRTLYDKGEFEERTTEQYFDPEAKMFLADRFVKGTCPKCGYDEAYGDQCENCGSSLSPTELKNPVSTLTGAKPELMETKHWYLSLDKNEKWLREWIQEGTIDGKFHHDPDLWKNHVKGQCMSWIDGGLQSRSMTRDLDWGIDVPSDVPGAEGKKLYVWMDAPIGYISATKIWAEKKGKNWKDYWCDEDTELIHFIGKDNIVFHCLIFPSILKSHGGYILPTNVPANQFLNLEGRKLSTSKGWAVWVHEYIEDFPEQQDLLRYSLTKLMPENKDSEFTWKGFQELVNNELVNNLGNFINRVIVLTNQYFEGRVPDFDINKDFVGSAGPDIPTWHDSELIELFDKCSECEQYILRFEFKNALNKIMEISASGNLILQANEPWKAIKEENHDLVKVVMNICLQYVTSLSVMIFPFLPSTSEKIRKLLNLDPLTGQGEMLSFLNSLSELEEIIPQNHRVSTPELLFTKVDDETIQKQLDKLSAADVNNEETEDSISPVTYDEFSKCEFLTATIIEAERVPKTDKLLKITIDLGTEKRTVISGIALSYNPEDIIGQKVLYLANLEPKKIRGIESTGMILMAENENSDLAFVAPPADWPDGSSVR